MRLFYSRKKKMSSSAFTIVQRKWLQSKKIVNKVDPITQEPFANIYDPFLFVQIDLDASAHAYAFQCVPLIKYLWSAQSIRNPLTRVPFLRVEMMRLSRILSKILERARFNGEENIAELFELLIDSNPVDLFDSISKRGEQYMSPEQERDSIFVWFERQAGEVFAKLVDLCETPTETFMEQEEEEDEEFALPPSALFQNPPVRTCARSQSNSIMCDQGIMLYQMKFILLPTFYEHIVEMCKLNVSRTRDFIEHSQKVLALVEKKPAIRLMPMLLFVVKETLTQAQNLLVLYTFRDALLKRTFPEVHDPRILQEAASTLFAIPFPDLSFTIENLCVSIPTTEDDMTRFFQRMMNPR
jgi:hypothetical protein